MPTIALWDINVMKKLAVSTQTLSIRVTVERDSTVTDTTVLVSEPSLINTLSNLLHVSCICRYK